MQRRHDERMFVEISPKRSRAGFLRTRNNVVGQTATTRAKLSVESADGERVSELSDAGRLPDLCREYVIADHGLGTLHDKIAPTNRDAFAATIGRMFAWRPLRYGLELTPRRIRRVEINHRAVGTVHAAIAAPACNRVIRMQRKTMAHR